MSHRIMYYLLSRILPSRYLCIVRRVRKISSRDRGPLTTLTPLSVTAYPFLSHQRGPCHIAPGICCREYSPRVIFALFAGSRSHPGTGGLLYDLDSGNLEGEELSENDGSFRLSLPARVWGVMEQDGSVVLGVPSVPVSLGSLRD